MDVIISDEEILYPRATTIDFFLSLAQEAFDRYRSDLASEAIILVDKNLVPNVTDESHTTYRFPFVEVAKHEFGNVILSNIIALAVMVKLTRVISDDALWRAIEGSVPKKYLDLNRQALERGFQVAVELRRGD